MRRAAAVALLGGLASFATLGSLSKTAAPANASQIAEYAPEGETLIHGVGWDQERAGRMPLSAMAAARLRYHGAVSADQAAARYHIGGLLLVIALAGLLGELLQAGGALPAAAACALALRAGEFRFFPDLGYAAIILVAACALVLRAREDSPGRDLLAAVAVGASLLYRSPLALLPPLLALGRRRAGPLRRALTAALPYVFLLPWLLLSWRTLGRLEPLEHGTSPNANVVGGALGMIQGFEGSYTAVVGEPIGDSNGAALRWAAREVARHPLRYAWAVVRRLGFAFSLHPWLSLCALLVFAALRRREDYRALALLAGYVLLLYCSMAVLERYFLPLWPLLAAGAAAPLGAMLFPGAAAAPRRGPAAAVAACVTLLVAGGLWADAAAARAALGQPRPGSALELAAYDRELARFPDDEWLRLGRARLRRARGDEPGAAQDVAAAARLCPDDGWARLAWAKGLDRAGRPAALAGWAPASIGDPNLRLALLFARARSAARAGAGGRARALLTEALTLWRANAYYVHGDKGRAPEAEAARRLRDTDLGFVRAFVDDEAEPFGDRERAVLLPLVDELVRGSPQALALSRELAARGKGR